VIKVELEQGGAEWLEARRKFIGGSDVPVIMGLTKYRTLTDLYLEKTGGESVKEEKFVFALGHQKEKEARAILQDSLGILLPPIVVRKADLPYCQVSLDGFNEEKGILVEIKYVGRDKFLDMKNKNFVEEYFYPQLQYQMLATGIKSMFLVGITADKLKSESIPNPSYSGVAIVEVPFDSQYALEMIDKCNKFFKSVQENIPPKEFLEASSLPLKTSMQSYISIFNKIKELNKILEDEKEVIYSLMENNLMTFNGLYAERVGKKVNVWIKN